MKKTNSSLIHIGFSSIVMVFIMICLVTFATLSVLTAHSDYRLSKKMADKTTAYYKADAVARDMAAMIDETLFELYQTSSDPSDFFRKLKVADFSKNIPTEVSDISLDSEEDMAFITYMVRISDVQTLHITLRLNYPLAESECFSTITRWQTLTNHVPEDSEEYYNLYTGNE